MKRCNWCKRHKPPSEFGEFKGKKRATCALCVPKKNVANTKYAHNEVGVASRSAYWKSDVGKRVRKKYNAGDGGKAAQKKWHDSEKGEAYKVVANERKRHAYANDVGVSVNVRLAALFKDIMKGQLTSDVINMTSFQSPQHVRQHFEAQFTNGMSLANHGDVWTIGHRIPRVYYDHANDADVKACWSPANMFPQTKQDNQNETCFITQENCAVVGSEQFPTSWNRTTPSVEETKALFDRAHRGELQ